LGVLTGDITPTSGLAYVAGHDVTGITPGGVAHARKHIGFCPQVDPLLELMTGRETLIMFGKLRGIPPDDLQTTVLELLDQLTLTPYADKVSQSYSGGNKRKLSLGVALIGDPRVLFIDEASSGMDPAARRHMWELIGKVSRKRSTVLTSHSMEEAEALCTRVAIMVKGKMLCLGSVQHVKTKYLDGYTIDVHCTSGTPDSVVDGLVQDILARALPGSVLAERHGRFLRFDMSSLSRLGLGTTFRRLQELKEQDDWRVENYSISQCSLEQVFIKLVKQGNSDATAIRGPTIL
jgi:ABC-type multidrug transport system ATPase subunit